MEKEDFLENLHVLSCFVQSKSVVFNLLCVLKSCSVQLHGIGNGGARRFAQISPLEELIGLSLATMIYFSDMVAKHMFVPLSQIRTDTENVNIVGEKEVNFRPVNIGIELLERTFEQISIADRNLIRQAWFHFPNFGIEPLERTLKQISIADRNLIRQAWFRFLNFCFSDWLSIILIAENMYAST